MECSFCRKNIARKSSYTKHVNYYCKLNPNRKKSFHEDPLYKEKQRQIRLKNGDCMTDSGKLRASERNKKLFQDPVYREKFSNRMKEAVLANPESYSDKNIVGRSKHFTIDGIRYNSSWEYEVAQYLTDANINWKRGKLAPEKYYWNESWHFYFPDFYLEDYNCYVEVKGYETERDRAKWKYSTKKIIVIKQKELDLIRNKMYNIHKEV